MNTRKYNSLKFLGMVLSASPGFLAPVVAPAREPSAPLSAYGRLPFLEDVSISPDGTRLAFVRTTEDSRNLYIMELSGEFLGGARVGNAKLRSVFWQDNDHVLAVVSSTRLPPLGFTGPNREWYQVERYTISKKPSARKAWPGEPKCYSGRIEVSKRCWTSSL